MKKLEIANWKLKVGKGRMRHCFSFLFGIFILQFAFCTFASLALAVPETTGVRIADVTTSSFSLVWMTDVAADPSVEVYTDSSLQQRLTEGILITPMPAYSSKAAQAAKTKGIMKVRVSGVQPAASYYVRTVTKDPANPDSVSYSSLQQVTTASNIMLYHRADESVQSLSNDLVAFLVYIRPVDNTEEPGLGDLIILEGQSARYPISSFVGDGCVSPEGILDLNNLFSASGLSMAVGGDETMALRVYRAGNLSTLTHYRKTPYTSGSVSVVGVLPGFFADVNLDGKIDDVDFGAFRAQYKTLPNDTTYNPDYDFVEDSEGKVDVREFSAFSKEYGRTDVQ